MESMDGWANPDCSNFELIISFQTRNNDDHFHLFALLSKAELIESLKFGDFRLLYRWFVGRWQSGKK